MSQGFVVGGHWKTLPFLEDCLTSLSTLVSAPVYVVVTDQQGDWPSDIYRRIERAGYQPIPTGGCWEVSAIRAIYDMVPELKEFFFLQDTVEVLDPEGLAEMIFTEHRGFSCPVNKAFHCYLGKYRREVLDRVDWPRVVTKEDAVRQEGQFTQQYLNKDPRPPRILFPAFNEGGRFEEKHGRLNRVVENEYLRKYRGTWHANLQQRLYEIDVEGKA